MAGEHVVIQTKLGKLRGQSKTSVFSGKTFYAFQGIPYAKPPLGELRFKAPIPFGSWEGVRDALEDGDDPVQDNFLKDDAPFKFPPGNEDCLYLNVAVNKLPEEGHSLKPVMFSIHGGGFAGGNGSFKMTGPDYLMEGDIVFVTFNYRCGALGFLSLQNEAVPGNAGLKDQVCALKWVKDNITSFGGDPNNITIFGISAGGASVDYQLISPQSKGLFQKAIVQSGFSTNPWAFECNPKAVAIHLSKQMGCTSEDPDDILSYLQSVSASDIVNATKELTKKKEFRRSLVFIFKPCVETSGANPFLPDTPHNLLKKGQINKVPIIIGCTSKEGALINAIDGLTNKWFNTVNENPDLLVPYDLYLQPGSKEESEAVRAIQDFFFKGRPLSWETAVEYLNHQGDVLFNIGMEKTRVSFLRYSSFPVYSYLFTNHSNCICAVLKPTDQENYSKYVKSDSGACHGADCQFLYTVDLFGPKKLIDEDKEIIQRHVKAWVTFAYVGDPNYKNLGVTWKKDSDSKPCFMEIGKSWEMKQGTPFAETMEFWKKLSS